MFVSVSGCLSRVNKVQNHDAFDIKSNVFLFYISLQCFMIQQKKENPYLSNCISLLEELFFFSSLPKGPLVISFCCTFESMHSD